MLQWFQNLDTKIKAVMSIGGLVGMLASGIWVVDARNAEAEEVVAQAQQWQKSLQDIKVGQLQSDRRALVREKFELENVPLAQRTRLEKQRLQEVASDIEELDKEIAAQRSK